MIATKIFFHVMTLHCGTKV